MNKFEHVAEQYSQLFYFSPYYMALAGLLEKHLGKAREVLEVGGGDGIVAMAWNRVRQESHNESPLTYRMVEPVKRMVEIAKSRANDLSLQLVPSVGTLDHAVASAHLDDIAIDGLIISRTLHEVLIQHNLDHERLFNDLLTLIEAKRLPIVVLGIVNRVTTLSAEETKRFIDEQIKVIGHGHDPAKEYVDQNLLDTFMKDACYQIIDREKITQPLEGFDPSPWWEIITVYQKARSQTFYHSDSSAVSWEGRSILYFDHEAHSDLAGQTKTRALPIRTANRWLRRCMTSISYCSRRMLRDRARANV